LILENQNHYFGTPELQLKNSLYSYRSAAVIMAQLTWSVGYAYLLTYLLTNIILLEPGTSCQTTHLSLCDSDFVIFCLSYIYFIIAW